MHVRRLLGSVLIIGALVIGSRAARAQEAATATPAQIDLSAIQPPQPLIPAAIATPTRTPTAVPPAVLQALSDANVRAEPDTTAATLGQIRPGDVYTVVGRYFNWVQFQFPSSPNGLGWVYGELVEITGDQALIPEIDLSAQATVDPLIFAATTTADAITRTPGGALTATALSGPQQIAPPGQPAVGISGSITTLAAPNSAPGAPVSMLPTFTYPPGLVALLPPTQSADIDPDTIAAETPLENITLAVPEEFPPILPIAGLGAAGLLGLLISSIRRR